MTHITHRRDLTHAENIKRLKIQDKEWPKNENTADDDTCFWSKWLFLRKKKWNFAFPKVLVPTGAAWMENPLSFLQSHWRKGFLKSVHIDIPCCITKLCKQESKESPVEVFSQL